MDDDLPKALADFNGKGYVVAPAGYGKTYLIARAVEAAARRLVGGARDRIGGRDDAHVAGEGSAGGDQRNGRRRVDTPVAVDVVGVTVVITAARVVGDVHGGRPVRPQDGGRAEAVPGREQLEPDREQGDEDDREPRGS